MPARRAADTRYLLVGIWRTPSVAVCTDRASPISRAVVQWTGDGLYRSRPPWGGSGGSRVSAALTAVGGQERRRIQTVGLLLGAMSYAAASDGASRGVLSLLQDAGLDALAGLPSMGQRTSPRLSRVRRVSAGASTVERAAAADRTSFLFRAAALQKRQVGFDMDPLPGPSAFSADHGMKTCARWRSQDLRHPSPIARLDAVASWRSGADLRRRRSGRGVRRRRCAGRTPPRRSSAPTLSPLDSWRPAAATSACRRPAPRLRSGRSVHLGALAIWMHGHSWVVAHPSTGSSLRRPHQSVRRCSTRGRSASA
jgi:hypothetical protein